MQKEASENESCDERRSNGEYCCVVLYIGLRIKGCIVICVVLGTPSLVCENVRFETPPKRQNKNDPPLLQGVDSNQEEGPSADLGALGVGSSDIAQFSRQFVNEVEERTLQSIETGRLIRWS